MKTSRILAFLIFVIACSCTNIKIDEIKIEPVETGMTGSIRGLHVVDGKAIWISGSQGQFAVSKDGGVTWYQDSVDGATHLDFRDVHGFGFNRALLMSAGPGDASRIYETSDDGKTWEDLFTNQEPKGFFDGFDFIDEQTGVLFSDPISDHLNMLYTRDGGRTWQSWNHETPSFILPGEYAFAASGTSLQFDPAGGVWLATGGSVARIWYASEVGGSWTIWDTPALQGESSSGLFSIAPRSGIRVVAVGGDYVKMDLKGSNALVMRRAGDVKWEIAPDALDLPFMECVKWLTNSALVACGPPGVWLSTDYGRSWKELSKEGFHTMDVDSKTQTVWLAGGNGKVSKMNW